MSERTPEPLAVPPRIAAQMLSVSIPTLERIGIPKIYLGPRVVRYSVEDLKA